MSLSQEASDRLVESGTVDGVPDRAKTVAVPSWRTVIPLCRRSSSLGLEERLEPFERN